MSTPTLYSTLSLTLVLGDADHPYTPWLRGHTLTWTSSWGVECERTLTSEELATLLTEGRVALGRGGSYLRAERNWAHPHWVALAAEEDGLDF